MAFGGVATGSMNAQVAARATGMTSSMMSWSMPAATPPMIGRKAAAVAVLEVISVRKMMRAVTASTISTTGSPPTPRETSPIQAERPFAVNIAERESPPPNSNRMSHGISLAVLQSRRGMPLRGCTGMRNSASAMHMAMSSSLMPASRNRLGRKIQESAPTMKTPPTSFSPRCMGPISSSSCRMRARPPGSSSISGRKNTLTSSHHAIARKSHAVGAANSIHWPNPITMSWLSAR